MKAIICLSFIVLNNFLQTSVKKNCASPTKSLTACHWSRAVVLALKNKQLEIVLSRYFIRGRHRYDISAWP